MFYESVPMRLTCCDVRKVEPLRRELARCLRTGRALRRPSRKVGQRKNRIPNMINISERPAEADDRVRFQGEPVAAIAAPTLNRPASGAGVTKPPSTPISATKIPCSSERPRFSATRTKARSSATRS